MLKMIKNFKRLNILFENKSLITNSIKLNQINKFTFGNNRRFFCESNKNDQKIDKKIDKENLQNEKNEDIIKEKTFDEKVLEFDEKLDSISSNKPSEKSESNSEEEQKNNEKVDEIEELKKLYNEFFDSKMSVREYKKIRKEYKKKLNREFEV